MVTKKTLFSRPALSIAAAASLAGASLFVGQSPSPTAAVPSQNTTQSVVTSDQPDEKYQGAVGSVLPSRAEIEYLTEEWDGKRDASGRPIVADAILKRLENVTIEQAWGYLREQEYTEQYAGNWKILHPGQSIIGRVLTAQYMPSSPGLESRMTKLGNDAGYDGHMNTWPIQMLEDGDVYVADGFGKVKDGTLIGGNLGQDIYDKTGNGVIFNGTARDRQELAAIDGFNAFVRGWHPSYIMNMMVSGVNTPIRIGRATVLPGDVVLAKRGGVVFIPAHMAEDLVRDAEETLLRDLFTKAMVEAGEYTSGELDKEWTPAIISDFVSWLKENKDDLPVAAKRVQEVIDEYAQERS